MAKKKNTPKIRYRPGNASFALNNEERLILLDLCKNLKPKTAVQKQCVKRFIYRLMGEPIKWVPLRPSQKCPICKWTYSGHTFEKHYAVCKSQNEAVKNQPKIDPTVWELLGGDVDNMPKEAR